MDFHRAVRRLEVDVARSAPRGVIEDQIDQLAGVLRPRLRQRFQPSLKLVASLRSHEHPLIINRGIRRDFALVSDYTAIRQLMG